ncbi:MAG: mannose-6-phosphate isomerase, class I [Propionibacteriaceae bacterium]|jgi:mannose-6-phosphate isomerase|nr:mannose-6-phosphate isomerase, class I [Propionibacteriaceae bacterium]
MLPLAGQVRNYAWGSPTAIPEILGKDPTGEPLAEYWLGAHPQAPATVDGVPLDRLLRDHPEWVGKRCLRAFGDHFPVLMKLLAAAKPLSLQAHPDRDQAKAGFAREEAEGIASDAPERTYKDDWPKPEVLIALTEFEGLCGFREPAATLELFRRVGVADDVDSVLNPLAQRRGSAALAQVFLDILSLDEKDMVGKVVAAARAHLGAPRELGDFARTAVELDAHFPRQPSILAALLLNRVHLEPGQAMYLPPRTLHSYLSGVGVEIMASSDNVLRGGLTKKHIDVDELIRVVEFAPQPFQPVAQEAEAPFYRYLTPAPEFTAWRGELNHARAVLPATKACRIALATDGEAELRSATGQLDLAVGEAALIPYGEEVTATGSATLFISAPGV